MSTTDCQPSDPLTWKQADIDVHVATRGGEFAGFVEFDGTGHLLQNHRGTELGSFGTLDDARRALEGLQATSPHWRGRPSAPVRALRRRPRRARG